MKQENIGIKVEAPNLQDAIMTFRDFFLAILNTPNDTNVKMSAFKTLRTIAKSTGAMQTTIANNLVQMGKGDGGEGETEISSQPLP